MPRIKSSSKDITKFVSLAIDQGWKVYLGGSGHIKFFAPDGQGMVVAPSTPGSNNRSIKNTRAALRRHGLDV